MSVDHLSASDGEDAAREPRRATSASARSRMLSRLAQPARVTFLAALLLGFALLFLASGQGAPRTSPTAVAASDSQPIAPSAAIEVPLAYAEPSTPLPTTPTPPAPVVAAETEAISAELALAPDEPVASQEELVRELRAQLSARGGLRVDESALLPVEASPTVSPSTQMMTVSKGVVTPKPTARPTKVPTPKKVATPRPVVKTTSSSLGQRVVSIALRYVGYRYRSGGTSPSTGFDCSGFVYYVYKVAGHPISRDIYAQYRTGIAVSRSSLRPGDLVFFQNTYRYGLSHASIYIGGGRIVHAQSESTGVTTSSLSERYWSSHYLGARRP